MALESSPKGTTAGAAGGAWLLRRMLCCAGTLVLMQNLMLLHWTAGLHLRHSVERAPRAALETAPPVPAVAQHEAKEEPLPVPPAPSAVAVAAPAAQPPHDTMAMESGRGGRQLSRDSSLFSIDRSELRLFGDAAGSSAPSGVVMTVGFGSVKRQKDYVLDTVGIMMGLKGQVPVDAEERAKVVIVAHFADFDLSWVAEISRKLQAEYGELIAAGQFHGIHAKEEFYPPLDLCPPDCNYKDEPKRVKWRSKQNVDYAFLMYYAAPLAPYYLQLEDDINFAPNWISKITGYLTSSFPPSYRSKENAPWRLIDFSQLGFIGKMFQSKELTRLAQFLLLFYDQMPCDILLGQWVLAMTQGKKIEYWKSHSSLFQHVGIFRSLGGFQTLQEKKFGTGPIFDNPPANITRNFTIVPSYDAQFMYFPGGDPQTRNDNCDFSASPLTVKKKIKRCWLWAKNVQASQHLMLHFQKPIPLKAILVEFGNDEHPTDVLQTGVLQVAPALPGAGAGACGAFHDLMPLSRVRTVYWEEGVSDPPHLPFSHVLCLRILALATQKEWLVILQMQIRSQ